MNSYLYRMAPITPITWRQMQKTVLNGPDGPNGPNELSALSKNKIVHPVYLVYQVHEMLVSLPADQTGIRLQRE